MGLELIGMVTTQVLSEAMAQQGPTVDPQVTAAYARGHEQAGFDRVLIGYSAVWADTWSVAAYALHSTDTLKVLIAHRPGFVAPTLAARKAATLDRLHGRGRVALNIVTGGSEPDQRRDGDFMPHDERYSRTAEYMELLRRTWASAEPFDHTGRHYRLEQAWSAVRPEDPTDIPLYYAGASDPAVDVGARLADVYMMWAEPRADAAGRLDAVRKAAARYGRCPRFALSVRVVLAESESAAWRRAERIAQNTERQLMRAPDSVDAVYAQGTTAEGSLRLRRAAERGDVLDERLWMTIARLTGAAVATTALVGTVDQVAQALLSYRALGYDALLLRGFDPLADLDGLGDLITVLRLADRDGVSRAHG